MMATNKGSGFATLTITLVLVSMLVAVSVFVGKVLVSDKRITLNEIEYRVAMAAAEKGIAEAMALLKVDSTATSVSGSLSTSAATASYQVTMTKGVPISSAWQLESRVTLDPLANPVSSSDYIVSVQVAERSILNPSFSGPAAPLVIGGSSTEISGNLTIVSNPNGGGPGIPVSVWSNGTLSGKGNMKICHQGDYDGSCQATTSTKSGGDVLLGGDAVGKDKKFPPDLLQYIFGLSDWNTIAAMGDVVTGCDKVKGPGFFIVDGNGCDVKKLTTTANAPVILVVKDANVTFNANTEFHGLLFFYDSDLNDGNNYSIQLNGTAKALGAIVSNNSSGNLNGTFDLVYDQDILCILAGCASEVENESGSANPFTNIYTIPGSWKDW